MNVREIKSQIVTALGHTTRQFDWVHSATLTGSFLASPDLEGISDIDFVVVVDQLNAQRYAALHQAYNEGLTPVLREHGFDLMINSTLGPLKFNAERQAVLHLMLYSLQAHVEHVISSPFTCFDWQRSDTWFERPLAEIYPVFGLQPRHFVSGRRGIRDYLKDLEAGVVSYRELDCHDQGYRETRRHKPMDVRDRHEFAYHVLRFLMQNALKLVERNNTNFEGEPLIGRFAESFPHDATATTQLWNELFTRKKSLCFDPPVPHLDRRLTEFVVHFETEFRRAFVEEATHHIAFRHAPTAWNRLGAQATTFQGSTDLPILPIPAEELHALSTAIAALRRPAVFVSPALRARQSLAALPDCTALDFPQVDRRLTELDYGRCEGLSVLQAQAQFPELFAQWNQGLDPHFPGGENSSAVAGRARQFTRERWTEGRDTVSCTHNVVLRCLVGEALGVPPTQWHRLRIPHLQPISFLQTKRFGAFVNLDEHVERTIFADFVPRRMPDQAIRAA